MKAWFIWSIAVLYFFFDFTNQVLPAALGNQLRMVFHADAAAFGFIASSYFFSYAILQIPIGLTVDHFGSRRPLAIAALIASTGCLLFSMADSPATAAMARMLVGAGAAFSFVSCLKLVSQWFPANRFATMVGLTNVVGMAGAVMGEGPIASLGDHLGWRETLWIFSGIGLSLAFIIFLFVKDKPSNPVAQSSVSSHSPVFKQLKFLLAKKEAWYTGLYAATINTSFIAFGALWGTLFIQTRFELNQVQAAAMVSMIFIGAIPGSFFFGWFADRIQRYKLPMATGAGGGLICMIFLLYMPGLTPWMASALLFALGFFCCGNVLAYASNASIGAKGAEGTSLGFTNTWLIGGSALFQPFIGWLLEKNHHSPAGELNAAFSLSDFHIALLPIVLCLMIALVMSLLIKETYTIKDHP